MASLIYQVKMIIAFHSNQSEEIVESYRRASHLINWHYSPDHPLHL